jgi:integrase
MLPFEFFPMHLIVLIQLANSNAIYERITRKISGKTPLSPTSIRRYKTNACVNRNIFEIKTHEFRHSDATRKIKMHVPINKVSKNLGHSSIVITLDIYVHNEKKEKQMLFSNVKFLQSIITHYV